MMNDLFFTMANDMGIPRIKGESDEEYAIRICYSGIGLWCLSTADSGHEYISKNSHTRILTEIANSFIELVPSLSNLNNSSEKLVEKIVNIYKETGYLQDKDYNCRLCNYGKSVRLGNKQLYLGIPNEKYQMNGLGIHIIDGVDTISSREFLVRDKLSAIEYMNREFDIIGFQERGIEEETLEYFDPKKRNRPTASWEDKMNVDFTLARTKANNGMQSYYNVIKDKGVMLFKPQKVYDEEATFFGKDYRRIIYALRCFYGNGVNGKIIDLDEFYVKLKLYGGLPNREYYFLKLLGWEIEPWTFIIKKEILSTVLKILTQLGIELEGVNEDEKQ